MVNSPLRIESTRGSIVEAVHHVSVAVSDARGRLVASAGDADAVTWWRSAAKPFQALPLLLDGAAERFAVSDEELALACASHSSEPRHLEVVSRWMERLGLTDQDLACRPAPPRGRPRSRSRRPVDGAPCPDQPGLGTRSAPAAFSRRGPGDRSGQC